MKQMKLRIAILVLTLLLLGGGLWSLFAVNAQRVTLVSSGASADVGSTFNVVARYTVDGGSTALSGLGFRIYFDDTKLEFTGYGSVLSTGKIAADGTPNAKTVNEDGDATTTKYLGFAWADLQGTGWPGSGTTLPLDLASLGFRVKSGAPAGPTNINVVLVEAAEGYGFVGTKATVDITVPPGQIKGTIAYPGYTQGKIYVGAYSDVGFTTLVKTASINAPGAYTVPDLAPGSYYLKAFNDYDGSGTYKAVDALGVYAGAVAVTSGQDMTGKDITLYLPSLTVAKTGTAAANLGTDITYTIAYGNTGGLAATGVVITDKVPTGTTFKSATGGGTESGGTVTWNIGNLAAGASGTVTLVVTATSSGLADQAKIANDTYGIDCAETAPVAGTKFETTVNAPVMSVSKVAQIGGQTVVQVPAGDDLTYVLTYKNTGHMAASGVVIKDTVPANTTFKSAADGGTESGGIVTWNIGAVAAGATVTVSYVVTVNNGLANGTLLSNATYSIDSDQTAEAAGTALATTVTSAPILAIGKTAAPSPVVAGQELVYTITYGNSGNEKATNVVIRDTVPANTTFKSATGGGTHASGVVTWTIGDLAAKSGPQTVTFTVTVSAALADGATVTNSTYSIACTQTATVNGTSLVTNVIKPVLTVAKTGTAAANLGTDITYTITYGNTGGADATAVVLTDKVPTGTVFKSADGGMTPDANGNLTWNIGALAKAATGTKSFIVTVPASGHADQAKIVNDTYGIDSAETDAVAGVKFETTVNAPVMSVSKVAQIGGQTVVQVPAGDDLTYVLTYKNTGHMAASGVVIKDTVPANTTFKSAADGGTESGGIVTWNIGAVAAGATATVSYVVTVNNGLANGTTLSNATYSIDSDQTAEAAGTALATTVTSAPILAISKTALPSPVVAGQELVYTITYSNSGNEKATNVVIRDTVPANTTYKSATGGGTFAGGVVTWNIGDLAAKSGPQTVTFTVTVSAALANGATVTNTTYSIACTQTATVNGVSLATEVKKLTIVPTVPGLAMLVNTTKGLTVTGGIGAFSWAQAPTTNSTITKTGDRTADFNATAVGVYTVTVTDAGTTPNATATADVDVINPIAITGKPAGDALVSNGTKTFGATGGKTEGQVDWEVNQGSITSAGVYTAPTVTTGTQLVTLTAYDKTYGKSYATPVKDTYLFTVYPKVAVTNKPAVPPVVVAGNFSPEYTAAGGNGTYTWTVAGPAAVAPQIGPKYRFQAPSTGNFAGEYTITVTDGKGFTDTFKAYVPIKLVTVDGSGNQIPSSFVTGNAINFKALGVATNLTVTATQNPVTGDKVVGGLPAAPIAVTTFAGTADNPGSATITVQDAADVNGYYKGSLQVGVVGAAQISGTVTGIPGDLDKTKVTVSLLDPMTKAGLDLAKYGTTSVGLDASNGFKFTGPGGAGVPWQSYWIQITVNDTANYVYNQQGTRILVNANTYTHSFSLSGLVAIAKSFALTVNVAPAGVYTANTYDYKLINNATGQVVMEATGKATAAFTENLVSGVYRLLIISKGYAPYEYDDGTGNKLINLTAAKTINATLTAAATFDPLKPIVEVTHEIIENVGFTLKAIILNFAGAFGMEIDAGNAVVKDSGTGTVDDPIVYSWDPTKPKTSTAAGTPGAGDTTYTATFTFKDGATTLDKKYTVNYVQYATQANAAADKSTEQTDLETLSGGSQTIFRILGETEFYPLIGTSFNITLKDATGAGRKVAINIPPIPLEYLYVDDGSHYTAGTDFYNIPAGANPVAPDDVLAITVEYFTLGGNAISNGATIAFKIADSATPAKIGLPVRYNPLWTNGTGRQANAPVITLPLLLNPQSGVFAGLKQLSAAKGSLHVFVSERGDGTPGFHVESVPFTVQDDGLVLIDTTHLSSWSLGSLAAGAASGIGLSDSSSDSRCFIATAAFGSPFQKYVEILRKFRDVYLLSNDLGRMFVNFYYTHSPRIASVIADHEVLKAAVRVALLPAIAVSYAMLQFGAGWSLLALSLMFGGVIWAAVVIRRRRSQMA